MCPPILRNIYFEYVMCPAYSGAELTGVRSYQLPVVELFCEVRISIKFAFASTSAFYGLEHPENRSSACYPGLHGLTKT